MKHKVIVGLNYPVLGEEKRAEPGECVDDLPEKSIPWLLRQGCISECGYCECEIEGEVKTDGIRPRQVRQGDDQ